MRVFIEKHPFSCVGAAFFVGMIVRGLLFYHGWPT